MKSPKAEELARRNLVRLIEMAIFGMTKRISYAVGAPHLEITYKRLAEENPSPAYLLANLSLKLDHPGLNPESTMPVAEILELHGELEGSAIASTTLKHLVLNHFRMFVSRYQHRQQILGALGIKYGKGTIRLALPEQRALPDASGSESET